MREIKFRAWNKDTKEFEEEFEITNNGEVRIDCNDVNCLNDYKPESNLIAMQYTGLKDKNGVEIYEGDIISDGDDIIEIKSPEWFECDAFTVYGYKYLVSFTRNYDSGEPSEQIRNGVVVGNIYQNKELIK